MSIPKTTLTPLINTYQQKDYVLWQILTAIANSNTALITSFNQLRTAYNWMMRLELDTVATGTSKLLSAERVYLPRDAQNNLVYTKVKPQFVGITAKTKPTGADFIGDIQFSRNAGVDYSSIFKTTTTLKLKDGQVFEQFGIFSTDTLLDGDLIRLNVSQTGSAAGLEIMIVGAMD